MAQTQPEPFVDSPLLPLGPDKTIYRKISSDGVTTSKTDLGTFVRVDSSAITLLTEHAMRDISHLLRTDHLQQLADILKDPQASDNDRFVALDLLKTPVSLLEVSCRCAKTPARQSLKPPRVR